MSRRSDEVSVLRARLNRAEYINRRLADQLAALSVQPIADYEVIGLLRHEDAYQTVSILTITARASHVGDGRDSIAVDLVGNHDVKIGDSLVVSFAPRNEQPQGDNP